MNESQNVLVKNIIGIALDDPFSTKAWEHIRILLDEVAIEADTGLIQGYTDGKFLANQVITREELAIMVVRAAKFAGFINGKQEMILAPRESATRAQAAAMLTRYLSYVGYINPI
ncbi:MAG TPA: S-layer homology domain-containing protein [Candidatus Paenibacillus intestinavium]|nr:S-layer homology domain-containing protein [Candidatus Paenibacillus intestinavium]